MIKFLDLQKVTAQYRDEIHAAASRVIESGWFLQGAENQRFEHDYAQYIGSRYCVGVANGLDALTLIFRAYAELGIMSPGDEVIVPANTYIASILAVSECGLKPVLVEPRLDTLEIDDSRIEEAVTPRTRAVMIVHLYGRCAYTERIAAICRKHGLKLIEDNAQAHGCLAPSVSSDTPQAPRRTGALGDAAGHSFYPTKNLGATGDAGAVTTDDEQLATVIRAIANYGSARKYVFDYRGRNSRLDELQAAILSVKLRHLDDDNRRRQQIAAYYYENIRHPAVFLPERLPDAQNVYHIFPIRCEHRDALRQHLADCGIETVVHYPIAPHRQRASLSLPLTEQIHQQELSLPVSPVLTLEEARLVVEGVNKWPGVANSSPFSAP